MVQIHEEKGIGKCEGRDRDEKQDKQHKTQWIQPFTGLKTIDKQQIIDHKQESILYVGKQVQIAHFVVKGDEKPALQNKQQPKGIEGKPKWKSGWNRRVS